MFLMHCGWRSFVCVHCTCMFAAFPEAHALPCSVFRCDMMTRFRGAWHLPVALTWLALRAQPEKKGKSCCCSRYTMYTEACISGCWTPLNRVKLHFDALKALYRANIALESTSFTSLSPPPSLKKSNNSYTHTGSLYAYRWPYLIMQCLTVCPCFAELWQRQVYIQRRSEPY